WSPDTSRPPLPTQPLRAEHPVTPVNAYATAFRDREGPLNAIDGLSDVRYETCWSTWGLSPALPHSITIDLGGVWSDVSTLEYLPKQWNRSNSTDGDITSYTISTIHLAADARCRPLALSHGPPRPGSPDSRCSGCTRPSRRPF
ncbi:discoidin domain-containing protein, partial [Streptomyces sp. JV178]|uniref:discoidin domain-containing protein n=1 Tax=Streptomyces sp. JV178 TaxID=858632 RepID=UPI00211E7EC0